MKGWILIYERLFGNKYVGAKKPYSRFEAWVWLLLEACRKKEGREVLRNFGGKDRMIKEKYGQITHSLRFMGTAWGWSKNKVSIYLLHLSDTKTPMITLKTVQQINQVTICKFELYQNPRDSKEDSRGTAEGQQRDSRGTNSNTLTGKQGEQVFVHPEEKLFEKQLKLWHGWRELKKAKGQEITERFSAAEEELCRQLVKMTGGDILGILLKMKKYLYEIDEFWSERKHPLVGLVQRFNEIELPKTMQPPPQDPEPEKIHSVWCETEPCTCSPEYLKEKGFWKDGFGMKEINEMFTRLRKDFKDHGKKP